MVKLGFDLDDGSSPVPGDAKQSNPQEARKLSIQRCIQSLVHACQCRDANCRLPSCQKMKRVVSHAKVGPVKGLIRNLVERLRKRVSKSIQFVSLQIFLGL